MAFTGIDMACMYLQSLIRVGILKLDLRNGTVFDASPSILPPLPPRMRQLPPPPPVREHARVMGVRGLQQGTQDRKAPD